jgi:soluble lytic murein transglycosylase-like protein
MTHLRLWDGTTKGNADLTASVKQLQKLLKIKADGVFGPATEEAVILFQKENKLVPDGFVGTATWAKLKPIKKFSGFQTVLDEYKSKYIELVRSAVANYGLSEPIIFAIGYRESKWGLALDANLTGDFIKRKPNAVRGSLPPDGLGYGRGLMQIDFDAHAFARGTQWKIPTKNIAYGCLVLKNNIKYFDKKKYDGFSQAARSRMAIAAYNCGAGRVDMALATGKDIDFYTAHRNYSADVIDLAAEFQAIEKETV